jgi:hypothetical protein
MMSQTLKRICIHWTAGGVKANDLDRSHYHFTVEQDGDIIAGNLPPESNIPQNGVSLNGQPEGSYMAHCGGGNSFTIGVSLCGMTGQNPNKSWKNPLTPAQCEMGFQLVAQLCAIYGIPVTAETVFTHYEFGLCNPNTPSAGKIDISVLPFMPALLPNQVGGYIRGRVSAYLAQIQKAGRQAKPTVPHGTASAKPPVPAKPSTFAPVPR